jgi:hypothetical protein
MLLKKDKIHAFKWDGIQYLSVEFEWNIRIVFLAFSSKKLI